MFNSLNRGPPQSLFREACQFIRPEPSALVLVGRIWESSECINIDEVGELGQVWGRQEEDESVSCIRAVTFRFLELP